ncbi:MAG: hypothetical protein LBU67_09560 [Oscillospiraceae bacterium]|jgi:hypothetical protein|nr:hypothetical protein [Oscillospiraceae bacterium]
MTRAVDGELCLNIAPLSGLDQRRTDLRYAAYAENADTRDSTALCPHRAPLQVFEPLPRPIGTLASFHRRYGAPPGQQDALVAAAGGCLYRLVDEEEGWVSIASGYACDDWDFVTYEVNRDPENAATPQDVLLMSNARDGMICVFGDDFHVETVQTPKKFGVICRHAERIWGGAIPGDPDMLVYSAPYDPFNWAQNDEIPEDGAGDILQPSWDGDGFVALRGWGEYLLAFKRDTVWRVLGTDPGQYTLRQQYGKDGPVAENTIASEGERVYMLCSQGVSVYAGVGVQPWQSDAARDVFARITPAARGGAAATVWRHCYLLALPLDGSDTNNALLVYDAQADSWMLRTGICAAAFCSHGERMLFTSATQPGRVYALDEGEAQRLTWVSPWVDLGVPQVTKSAFRIHASVQAAQALAMDVAVQTERGAVRRALRVPADSQKTLTLPIPARGKRFRLMVIAPPGIPWRMPGGITLRLDMDGD